MWKPKEIIVHEAITDDPATQYFLDKCPDVPVKYVADSKSETIKEASTILKNSGNSMLEQIKAGKQVVFIAPTTKQVDEFQIEDRRILCPCFPRVKLAFNGCYYSCDWCYLKLTYRAQRPYITIKVQYDTIKKQLQEEIEKRTGPVMFNSGELGDSLALDHLTGANKEFIPWFGQTDNAYLFMLSKSDNVDEILDLPHNNHTILTWSINNENVAKKFEIGAPTIERRLNAAAKVQEAGYPVRIRLDPVIPINNWKSAYAETVKQIFDKVSPESITIGTLRFEPGFYGQRKTIFSTGAELESHVETMNPMFEPKLYPGDKKTRVGKYSFPEEQRIEIFQHIMEEIKKYSDCPIALCKETSSVWKATGLDTSQCSCVCQFESADMSKIEIEIQEDSSMETETKPEIRDEIEFISGSTNILLVAPHGHHLDDENTGELTRLVAEQSGCYAIINEYYGKELDGDRRIDLNDLVQVKKHLQDEFLNPLLEYKNKMVEEHGSAWIFWIHGANNKSIVEDIQEGIDVNPNEIKVLVGYGQDAVKAQKRLTAKIESIEHLIQGLNNVGLEAVPANNTIRQENLKKKLKDKTEASQKSFCGWTRDNMNQLFRDGEYREEKVQSFQLEFRKLGCRDTAKNIEDTAHKLVKAISSLLPAVVVEAKPVMDDVDDEKVEKAYAHLKNIFVKHFHTAMLECGQYLVETFYNDNYELAQEKKFTRNKSLSMLIKKIQNDATEKGDAPSRTWLYDAVNLAIDDYLFEQKQLPSVYGQLGHSHKVNLTSAPDEVKPALVQEAFDKEYTVAELRDRIREEKDKLNPDRLSLKEAMSIKKLVTLESKQLKALKAKTEGLINKVQDEAKLYQGNLALIEKALNKK